MKQIYIVLFAVILPLHSVSYTIQAQENVRELTVSGTITDMDGNLMLGVMVTYLGSTKWSVSNQNGIYTIKVPENSVLIFQYIGFEKQEIKVSTNSEVNVKMKPCDEGDAQPSEIEVQRNPENAKKYRLAQSMQLTEPEVKKIDSDNQFALRVFKKLSQQEGENPFFSPMSLSIMIGMLYNGASEITRSEILKELKLQDISAVELNNFYKSFSKSVLALDPISEFTIANSLWYGNDIGIKSTFSAQVKEYFDAEVKALDFSSPEAVPAINHWCATKTGGKIANIISNPLPAEMSAMLVNAIYFKSKWYSSVRFDKNNTKPDDFTRSDRSRKKVSMMEQLRYVNYVEDNKMQCAELDFGNRAFSMVIILPSPKTDINNYLGELDNNRLKIMMDNFKLRQLRIKLPRFKAGSDFMLNDALKRVGMKGIFNSDFTRISDQPVYVSAIQQKTFVEVNEDGVEAAAATASYIIAGAVRRTGIEPVNFFVNRPFLYLIREKSSGAILFIGRMDNPKE